MTSFKIELCVHTTSNDFENDLIPDFEAQNGSKIGPISVPNRAKEGLERASNDDVTSHLIWNGVLRPYLVGGEVVDMIGDAIWGGEGASPKYPNLKIRY